MTDCDRAGGELGTYPDPLSVYEEDLCLFVGACRNACLPVGRHFGVQAWALTMELHFE